MTTLEEDTVDHSYSFSQLPIDNCLNVMFTCHYNGFGLIMKSQEEMSLLYHIGKFGKGSKSRSKPHNVHNPERNHIIIRKRQYDIRNTWYKKLILHQKKKTEDSFIKDLNEVVQQIKRDKKNKFNKKVIDLISSDEDSKESDLENEEISCDDTVIIVPNSDSDENADSDYFKNMKPKCCLNKIKIEENLMLSFQEAFFLAFGLCCLQIFKNNNKLDKEECWQLFTSTDHKFTERYVVYHYFRCKGYIVKPGIKFGGDYVLYKEGPGLSHADYIVVIKYKESVIDWITILCLVRMATTTVKQILIAEVIPPLEETTLPQGLKHYTVKETIVNRGLYKSDE